MATRSRDDCRTRYRPQGWFWTVRRVISLSFLTFLKVSAYNGKTTCSMPSVEPLDDTVLTCHFPEDLGLAKKDFTIYHYDDKSNPDAVVDCWWLGGTLDCFSKLGFIFDKTVSNNLRATATRVNSEHEGSYACQVAGYGPSSLGTCEFQLKFDGRAVFSLITITNCAGEENTCNIVQARPNNQANLTCYFNEDVRKSQRNVTVYRHTGPDQQNPVLNCWWDGQEPKCWVESGYTLFPQISSHLILRLPNADGNYSCGHTKSVSRDKKMCQMIKGNGYFTDKGSGKGQTEETTQTVAIIVGIIVGVVVLTILGIFLLIFLTRRRSAINRKREDDEAQQVMLGWSKSNTRKGNKSKVKLGKKRRQLITQQFSDYLLTSVKDMFPDIMEGCFFVPPVYFNTTRYTTAIVADQVANIPESPEASLVTHDKAVQRVLYCLRHLAEHRRENMFLVTQFKYEDYLNGDQTFLGHTLPKATDLVEENKEIKCLDLMIIHRQHGILLGVVVDVGLADDSRGDEEEDKTILSHLSVAIQQLKKADRVVSHVMSDLSQCLLIRKTLIFPHLSLSSLQRALEADVGLAEELRGLLNINIFEKSARGVCTDFSQKISEDRHQTLKQSDHSTSNLTNDHANNKPDNSVTTVTADPSPKHVKNSLKRKSKNSTDTTFINSNTSSSKDTTPNRDIQNASETSEIPSPEEVQCPATETAKSSSTDTTDDHAEIVDNQKNDTKSSEGNRADNIEVATMEIPTNAPTKMHDASARSSSKNSIAETSDSPIGETSNNPMGKTPNDPIITPIRVCLCADHLSDPQHPSDITPTVLEDLEQWWSLLTPSSSNDMKDDLYLKVISRVCGPATTPTLLMPGDSEPVLLPKTLEQAVSLSGELFERLTLYSDMTDLLKEPRLFLCGPPATGKTTMLMLAGRSWLLEGHDVRILKLSESRLEQSLKLDNSTRISGNGVRGQVFVYSANIHDEKSRKTAMKEILKRSGKKPAHIIADELECDTEEVKDLIEFTLNVNNNKDCMWITNSRGSRPLHGWRTETLTRAVRCPPVVVREASTILSRHFPDVRPYSPSDFPAPTDGPPVKLIYHAGQGHTKGQPRDCEQCAKEVVNFLTRIIRTSQSDSEEGTSDVTQKASQGVGRQFSLHAKDVMILFESEVDQTRTTMLKKLIEAGIFVDVTAAPSAGENDVALAGEASLLRGEKRKVVVYVEDNVDNSDIWWTRLRGITSCYSQLIRVINSKSVHKA